MRRLTAALLVVLSSCSDVLLQPTAKKDGALDDRLALRGEVCTAKPDPSGFPVKVVFLIDKSGSMCVSDPPGSQESSSFCSQFANGFTEPGRVRAMKELMKQFRPQPNVYVALDPFESKIDSAFPSGTNGQFFVPAKDLSDTRIGTLQANLGKGTDYQGAMAQAYFRIESDILATNPQLRPRTRYVVVLLTDGAPYPRCAATDDLPASAYADVNNPSGIWKDNPDDFCNATDADTFITGFKGGADRNQNYQLFDSVDRLMELREKYNVGDIRLHTILLFNVQAATACGQLCSTDLYNGLAPQDMRQVATWLLTQMAEVHGNGTFQEFTTAGSIQLGALDYSSLASRFAAKVLYANNVNAFPTEKGPVVDSDGDGLPDDKDNPFTVQTSRFDVDSDGDGFSDAFENARRDQGFDPMALDPRGCKAVGMSPAKYSCRDTDGDGLTEPEEAFLKTSPVIADSDADGVPDGLEVMRGLNPLERNGPLADLDLDGMPDVSEILTHLNPRLQDASLADKEGYRYDVKAVPQDDGRVCYDFNVSNIKLLTPESQSGQQGFNLVTLTFGEAPESNVSRDYGAFRAACAWAQFAPPSVRVPADPEITIKDGDFNALDALNPSSLRTLCKGTPP